MLTLLNEGPREKQTSPYPPEDIEKVNNYIATLDVKVQAQIWCKLNSFIWPDELKDFKLASCFQGECPVMLCELIMLPIIDRITFKECLREWNAKKLPGLKFDAR